MGEIYTNKEKVNTLGNVTGIYFSYVPLYQLIKFFTLLPKLEKKSCKKIMILSYVFTFALFIVCILTFIRASSLLGVLSNLSAYETYGDLKVDTESDVQSIISFVTLAFVLFIITLILRIVSGITLNKWIKSTKGDNTDLADIYELSKLAALFLTTIPFYKIVKLIISRRVLETISSESKSRLKAFIVILIIIFALSLVTPCILLILKYNTELLSIAKLVSIKKSSTVILRIVQFLLFIVAIDFGIKNNKTAEEVNAVYVCSALDSNSRDLI